MSAPDTTRGRPRVTRAEHPPCDALRWLLKWSSPEGEREPDDELLGADETGAPRIRCPLCGWQPTASSRWTCECRGTPEPPFACCGAVWNTFATRGRCPGCGHQWIWTSCLRCGGASRHEDWYEKRGGGGAR
jgi:hypothetical protein